MKYFQSSPYFFKAPNVNGNKILCENINIGNLYSFILSYFFKRLDHLNAVILEHRLLSKKSDPGLISCKSRTKLSSFFLPKR